MKHDGKDVYVHCLGHVNGCKVSHCDVARLCKEMADEQTLENERRASERDSAEIDHDDPINRG